MIDNCYYINAEETEGVIIIDGQKFTGPIPPNASDIKEMFDNWITEGNVVGSYVTPTPEVPTISDRQFFQQLAIQGTITEDEAEEAVATGTIPAAMLALINVLPEEQRFTARMMLKGAVIFERNHPLTIALGTMYGWTNEQIDNLFRNAATL